MSTLSGEVVPVTVATKVQKALAHLHQAQAAFEVFALDTQDKSAQDMYRDAAKATKVLAESLEDRLEQIQEEEPEYRTGSQRDSRSRGKL